MNAYDIAKKYGMLEIAEVDLIKRCMYPLPERPVIVNIGANVGTGVCAILEAKPKAFIFSIDTKPCIDERNSIDACGMSSLHVVRLLGKSWEIGARFPYKVDAVFIDGAHHLEAIQQDISVWLPRCKQVVMFHDYHHPNYTDDTGYNYMDFTVDNAVQGWKKLGEARYLVGFERL